MGTSRPKTSRVPGLAAGFLVAGLLLSPGLAAGGTAQVNVVAERVFLGTQPGGDQEVAVPAVGQEVFVHVAYRVAGATVPVVAEVRALIDGVVHCIGDVSLQPGDTFRVWCQNGWLATAGQHTLRWELDSGNVVAETNETDNAAEASFTVPAPVIDAVAERAYLRTGPGTGGEVPLPAVGQEVFFQLDYRLSGATQAIRASIRALIDGGQHCGGAVDLFPGGTNQAWCTNVWAASAGVHTLVWQVDTANEIAESNEQNNTATSVFYAGEGPGDANCDGAVSAADLTRAVTLLIAETRSDCGHEDADENDVVDERDLDATIAALFR